MDVLKIEEELADHTIVIMTKPCDDDLQDLRNQYDVTDLGNGNIQITYK